MASTSAPPPVSAAAGQIINSNTAGADASVHGRKADSAIAITTQTQFNPKLAEGYCRRGIAYGQKGSYDRAIADLTEAIRLNPKLALAYCGRGSAYGHKGNHDRATADFNQAIRLDPNFAVAYYGRGCAYWYYGQKAKAEEDFAQAKRLGYKSPWPSSTSILQISWSALLPRSLAD
jgi:tetratricopeptide (TPR) repeat protein